WRRRASPSTRSSRGPGSTAPSRWSRWSSRRWRRDAVAAPWDDPRVGALIDLALAEDLGVGDRTSEALVPAGTRARGRVRAKQALVVCGLPLLDRVFRRLGDVSVSVEAAEGALAAPGQVLATLEGQAHALLAGERVALNLLQHLCGIATLTRGYVKRVHGTPLVVRDTRKTLPGMRALAKYAVRTGGGTNHRLGLDDAILIKDNHLALVGGDLAAAVRKARAAARAARSPARSWPAASAARARRCGSGSGRCGAGATVSRGAGPAATRSPPSPTASAPPSSRRTSAARGGACTGSRRSTRPSAWRAS